MAEPLRFTGLDHISLTVSDLQKSLDFYQGLFDANLRKEAASERYYVRLGSGYLALGEAAPGRGLPLIPPKQTGASTFVIQTVCDFRSSPLS
jgi:catechol 2,3-dioxygenase-like lactoylglutathione lyase family enzyme